jgi:Uma2 family endonuclease
MTTGTAQAQIGPGPRRLLRGMNPLYPWSDGKPMAENSTQYRWIVTIQSNLERMFRDQPDVFVAADNLIYPVEGKPEICQAPDVYVAFGVPKDDRGSFLVFEEGVFPQVVFEVRSPSNTTREMTRKLQFYDQYGAEEYYDFDPKEGKNRLRAYVRFNGALEEIETEGYVSRRLGISFDLEGEEMVIYGPDGRPFLTQLELGILAEQAEAERQRAEAEHQRAEVERQRAEVERQRAETASAELTELRKRLRAAGIDPDSLP